MVSLVGIAFLLRCESAARLQIRSCDAAEDDLQTTPFGVLIVPEHAAALITLRSVRSFVPIGCGLIY